jgi:hypothetical protein
LGLKFYETINESVFNIIHHDLVVVIVSIFKDSPGKIEAGGGGVLEVDN